MPTSADPNSGRVRPQPPILLLCGSPSDQAEVQAAAPDLDLSPTPARDPEALAAAIQSVQPRAGVVIVPALPAASAEFEHVVAAARGGSWPLLWVVADDVDPNAVLPHLRAGDDWLTRGQLARELGARLQRLVAATPDAASTTAEPAFTADASFLALVVHDLRTPLNVIGLSLRMIMQAVPRGNAELDEDLRFVEENFRQIERMLAQLSEYFRLFEASSSLAVTEFSPRRLVDELLESRTTKAGLKSVPVLVEVRPDSPTEVRLDPLRARLAIQYALVNATAASTGVPIRLVLRGNADRWIIEVALDQPPPSSVRSVRLEPQAFERLCGFAAERRGMDLAIAARVSELFGGTARLDVVEAQGTQIVLDWPTRLSAG